MLVVADQVWEGKIGRIQNGLAGGKPLFNFLLLFQFDFPGQILGIENAAANNTDTQQGKEPAPVEAESDHAAKVGKPGEIIFRAKV